MPTRPDVCQECDYGLHIFHVINDKGEIWGERSFNSELHHHYHLTAKVIDNPNMIIEFLKEVIKHD